MGKYSHTGLAYGTQGSPQITIDENIYSMKITEISNQLQLNLEQSVKEKTDTVTNAQNNIFELLASISNEIEPNIMLKTIKNILTKLQ